MSTQDDKNKDPNKTQPEIDEVTNQKLLEGHEFDGIRELDNRLPPWLKYLFYVTIVFAITYLIRQFVFKDDNMLQRKEYQHEMTAAMAPKETEAPEEGTGKAPAKKERSMDEIMASGKQTFTTICAACHGQQGQGSVGPNFADDYWIHGCSREDMHKVIVNGVIEKGMISFKNQLSEAQIEDVITYIKSLRGTNPPNPKAPQGEKCIPDDSEGGAQS
ncbi:MAG TPA: cbb3-type cytochrome c oxidase N-terminal domain-containing protein [Sunxiuqinia sp.]|nr:cbb3-type cytochrome c oxidase N-terminal domain-containing protein [Sunxiuqinia sp.]